ncbi:class I SAM-dependent methyltransferase [Pseudooceanicola sediminis]|uniref:Class I SAM-dependent methyltransferase n=1 Tax=Pseudooceanicola sediminis TaxID=2211117 RepID=A0A399IX27_9RHOB|nr:methyltransferase [Pseudooceanicola sediminis]KAA2312905.1 class I SAM-dependent methyltransferase [Puniceibacterium sp. HSS470]RII37695.1 class I SAM-dependent methyltransferase [Pseudooceanicola sediminis]|tara:strand:+ start:46401 stop:47492 length:1092 start_codon:yes stop_codon:yes gene_type:complete
MTGARLTLALEAGGLVLPEGRIAILSPRAGADLSALPKDRCHVITGFRPDHAAFAAAGYGCAVAPEGRYDAVLVCLPRAKAAARALIATARGLTDGVVIVDGQKEDGIESILKESRARVPVEGPVNKAHGKMFWMSARDMAGDVFADWQGGTETVAGGFVTAPGVFSADGIDPGSRFLADTLPPLRGRVADLGAGWGYLSARLLENDAITTLDLIEADHAALECARANISDPRASFHWEDAREWRRDSPYDAVVMNPPFHTGRTADPELGRAFIRAAARLLSTRGTLYLVANRHLGYETVLDEIFGKVSALGGDRSFKVLSAERPTRQGAAQGVRSGAGHKDKETASEHAGRAPRAGRNGKHR